MVFASQQYQAVELVVQEAEQAPSLGILKKQ